MLTIQQIQERAYATACSKGWHDRPLRELAGDCVGDPPQIVIHHDRVLRSHALMHTEITEAFECWEARDLALRIDPDTSKPEGLAVELADLIIRVCDTMKALDLPLGLGSVADDWINYSNTRPPATALRSAAFGSLSQSVAVLLQFNTLRQRIDQRIDQASESARVDDWVSYSRHLGLAVLDAAALVLGLDLDLAAAIESKMSYNEMRPHRHGGKQA